MLAGAGFWTIRGLEDSFIHILRRCNKTRELKTIHAQMEKLSLTQSNFLVTRMLDICDQNGSINYATMLFHQICEPNIFLYNAMIRAYTHNSMYAQTINVYKKMLTHHLQAEDQIFPDRFTYPFVIRSCGALTSVWSGKQIQGQIYKFGLTCNNLIESSLLDMYVKCDQIIDAHKVFDEMSERDVISWNSLISGYAKSGRIRKAQSLFKKMPNKTIVSWTAMISGYTKAGLFNDATNAFKKMQANGLQPDWISLVSVLPACAQSGSLELGKWIHSYAAQKSHLKKTCVSNALIEMYTKCGFVGPALQIFNDMSERDVVSWSTMITGLAHHGRAHEAIRLFGEMNRARIDPNEVTFVGLLSACAHVGLLEEGLSYFESMGSVYNIEPGIEHYGCMVDLMGRTGHIDRALKLIKSMKVEPDSAIWGSLLSSCRTYRDLETAVLAMEKLLVLEPEDMGNLVLLANIYADVGKWEEVSRMRRFIRSRRMKKTPGCSSIEVDGVMEGFVSGDDSKAFSEDVFGVLEVLALHQLERDDWVEVL
ncbi:pentatricopeptide repeat-containing family protein [Striga asiatica]|uniref:Pentatricopeptide repeat-containing family protein n=1 Tax=Striga asiatica TaxID=4170 RepID=A0A5A7Q5G3_STRAF|nr:pentatricopeptide repeat-containing family protein [Striga asiatica]